MLPFVRSASGLSRPRELVVKRLKRTIFKKAYISYLLMQLKTCYEKNLIHRTAYAAVFNYKCF